MLRRCVRSISCGEWMGSLYSIKFHTNVSKVLCSSFDKDLPNPRLPTPVTKALVHDVDILLEQLKKARSVERILELASLHLKVMNAKHIVICMEHLSAFATNQEYYKGQDLMNDETFQSVCTRLMKIIRFLDSQDIITVYKALSTLGVRNNTYVMQCVLKMMGSHLNDMNLGQLTFLNFLLAKQKHNTLVDGLRLALPLVLQVQIEQELDSDNLTEVVNCLQLACRSRLKPATIQKVLNAVLKKAKLLSPLNATTVIFALLNLETPMDGYKELLNYSFEVVANNPEQTDERQIIAILRLCGIQKIYNSPFSFAVADKITSEKWNLENTWEAMRQLYRLNFAPPNLMDHLVDTIRIESDVFRTTPGFCPLQLVEFLTATGHHPPHLDEVLQLLCSCEEKIGSLIGKSPFLTIKFIGCLAILGYFPKNLLSQIHNEEYLLSAWSSSRKQGRSMELERSLFSLAWGSDVYDQQDCAMPSLILKKLVQNACERNFEYVYPLQKFIESGLGGSQFLKSGIFTRDGLRIDHVVAMRSGNYPVNLQSPTTNQLHHATLYLEDIILPGDAKIVSVIVAHEDKYCSDPAVLKGWMDLKVKCLAKRNFSPVVINFSIWSDLPDREKIPYLMQAIKNPIEVQDISNINSISQSE